MTDITLQSLADFPHQLAVHYAAIPASFARWTPPSWDGVPSERFSAIEQVLHLRDIETLGYHVRFRRALEEDHPVLEDIDSYALGQARGYAQDNDARHALQAFRSARAETVELLSRLEAEEWRRPAHFGGYGAVTVRSLMHYLCSHDQQHLAGLQWLMGQMELARVQEIP